MQFAFDYKTLIKTPQSRPSRFDSAVFGCHLSPGGRFSSEGEHRRHRRRVEGREKRVNKNGKHLRHFVCARARPVGEGCLCYCFCVSLPRGRVIFPAFCTGAHERVRWGLCKMAPVPVIVSRPAGWSRGFSAARVRFICTRIWLTGWMDGTNGCPDVPGRAFWLNVVH